MIPTAFEPLRYRAAAACGLAEMEAVSLESGRQHTRSQWERLEQAYLCYRAGATHMANVALSMGVPRWHMRPKCHMLEHGIYDFHMKNLRYMSNYLDEDMVRRVKKIALSANPRFLAKHVVFRYAICATLKWCGMISWEKVAGMTASVFWLKLSKQTKT